MKIKIQTEWLHSPFYKSDDEFIVDDSNAELIFNNQLKTLRIMYDSGYYRYYSIKLISDDGEVIKKWRNFRLNESRFYGKKHMERMRSIGVV